MTYKTVLASGISTRGQCYYVQLALQDYHQGMGYLYVADWQHMAFLTLQPALIIEPAKRLIYQLIADTTVTAAYHCIYQGSRLPSVLSDIRTSSAEEWASISSAPFTRDLTEGELGEDWKDGEASLQHKRFRRAYWRSNLYEMLFGQHNTNCKDHDSTVGTMNQHRQEQLGSRVLLTQSDLASHRRPCPNTKDRFDISNAFARISESRNSSQALDGRHEREVFTSMFGNHVLRRCFVLHSPSCTLCARQQQQQQRARQVLLSYK